MVTLNSVKRKVESFFALRIGETVIVQLNGEVKLCMDILTPGGLKIANGCIEALTSQGTDEDEVRVISAAIGTPSKAMLQ